MTGNRPRTRRTARAQVGLTLLVALALALAACGQTGAAGQSSADEAGENPSADESDESSSQDTEDDDAEDDTGDDGAVGGTVTIEHAQGTDEVPVNPDTVVALSNRDFSTLSAMGVELAAAPVSLMGDGTIWPEYAEADDVGSHREPNLEVVIAAEADLIITGTRMSQYYDDLVADNPESVVIDTTPDTENADLGDEAKHYTEVLGQLFDAEDVAAEINAAYDDAVAAAQEAYNGEDTVMGLITSGGSIQYSAPVTGRSIGPLFPILDLQPALEEEAEDTSHGDEISVEAIAEANPDWIIVLDRDGATSASESDYQPAQEVIGESEALANTTAVSEDQVIYLDSSFYLTEDIQAYTGLFEQITEAFSDSS